METYLGRHFNHGAVLLNIMPWGMGGEALRNRFFRVATESPECLAAYAKFLRHEPLVESAPTGLSFRDKMDRIGKELPGLIHKTGQQARVMPLIQKIKALVKDQRIPEADKVADELLALMKGNSPAEAKTQALPLMERLPPKVQKIQRELPAWIGADADKKKKATALMKQMDEQMKAKNFEEVEKTADAILKLMEEKR